jgi:hypothetical protein
MKRLHHGKAESLLRARIDNCEGVLVVTNQFLIGEVTCNRDAGLLQKILGKVQADEVLLGMTDDFKLKFGRTVPPESPRLQNLFEVLMWL